MQKAANKLYSIVAKIMLMLILVCATASVSTISAYAAQDSLLSTYGATYGYSGTCINLYQLKDANTLQIRLSVRDIIFLITIVSLMFHRLTSAQ